MKKINIVKYTTFTTQIEILPRFMILYGKTETNGYENMQGFAIEWLWFGIFIEIWNRL